MAPGNASFLPYERVVALQGIHAPLQRSALALFGAWCAFTVFFLATLVLYMLRRDLQPIKSRMPFLCAVPALFGWITVTVHAYEAFLTGPSAWPCWAKHWTIWVVIPGTFVAYPWRAFRLIMVARLADWIAYHHRNTMTIAQSLRSMPQPMVATYSNPMREVQGKIRSRLSAASAKALVSEKKQTLEGKAASAGTKMTTTGNSKKANHHRVPSKRLTGSAFSLSQAASVAVTKKRIVKRHRQHKVELPHPEDVVVGCFACCHNPQRASSASLAFAHIKALRLHIRWTNGYAAVVIVAFAIAALVTQIVDEKNAMFGCVMPNTRTVITYAVCIGLVVATNIAFMVILVHEGISDNFSIRAELSIVTVCMLIFVVPYVVYLFRIRDTCSPVLKRLPVPDRENAPTDISWGDCIWVNLSDWSIFLWVGISYCTSIGWPLWQSLANGARALRREDDTKKLNTRKIPKNSWRVLVSLQATLEDESSRAAFFEFLKSEFSPENLLFYDACEAFRTKGYWKSGREKFDAAKRLYLEYIKPNKAPYEVNLPSKIRAPLQAQFDKDQERGRDGNLPRNSSLISETGDGCQIIDYTNSVTSTMEISSRVFVEAQQEIFALMESDSFARFKRTDVGKNVFLVKTKNQSWDIASEEANLV